MMLDMEVYKVANMVKENTFKEQSLRLLTFETFDQGDEKTRPDQQKNNDEDNHNENDKYNDNDKYI